ncbi:hypothetical protein MSG28_011793 [Choristoneura fumiferana]|uniref:Uncharacterized protein n=1 Tax=Choristoneura fumiferana TaxID=7141 RepID=A0ACC0KLL9_CHOFU|nr:hypothetical protein MSG28_011793 [Choristoneura fumiferana]
MNSSSEEQSNENTQDQQGQQQMNAPPQHRKINMIRSKAHQLYTQTINKIALNNYDDKRFPIPDKKHQTLALGHYRIDKYYELFIDLPE